MPDRTELYDTAAIDRDTVTQTSRRLLDREDPCLFRRPRTKTEPVVAAPVETRTLAHPGVWTAALNRAGGDVRRLVVHSWTHVEVLDL